ncbi:MAG: 50S ribosomal protein L18 [Candidatus Omnitrophota bacterium]
MRLNSESRRIKRHNRSRINLKGTEARLRLVVHRSLKNISAQLINDNVHTTVLSMSTLSKDLKGKLVYGGNIKAATILGQELAKKMEEKNIKQIAFDRGGYLYHGRIKAFADALRKGGIEF